MLRFTRLPNESEEYVKAREELRLAEVELIAQRERVAEQRRSLPLGPAVEDYVFLEGPSDLGAGDTPAREVRLSELFSAPDRPLVIYELMYGKAQTTPCPMCTMWIDGFNGVAPHIQRNVDFAIAAAASLGELRDHARRRGWHRLRLLSCAGNTFKYDLNSEEEKGGQQSAIAVFTKDAGGAIRHRYSGRPERSEELFERGIDQLSPVWNILDLTPPGRGDWYPALEY